MTYAIISVLSEDERVVSVLIIETQGLSFEELFEAESEPIFRDLPIIPGASIDELLAGYLANSTGHRADLESATEAPSRVEALEAADEVLARASGGVLRDDLSQQDLASIRQILESINGSTERIESAGSWHLSAVDENLRQVSESLRRAMCRIEELVVRPLKPRPRPDEHPAAGGEPPAPTEQPDPPGGSPEPSADTTWLDGADLPKNVKIALKRKGLTSSDQVTSISDRDLLKLQGIGPAALAKIRAVLPSSEIPTQSRKAPSSRKPQTPTTLAIVASASSVRRPSEYKVVGTVTEWKTYQNYVYLRTDDGRPVFLYRTQIKGGGDPVVGKRYVFDLVESGKRYMRAMRAEEERVPIPNVQGRPLVWAKENLGEIGFVVDVIDSSRLGIWDDMNWIIASQFPDSGSAPRGTTVTLRVRRK